MKTFTTFLFSIAMLFGFTAMVMGQVTSDDAWINEFHYDNSSTDEGEFVEVVIKNAGNYTLSDFTLTLYNGDDNASYESETLDTFTEGVTIGDYTLFHKEISGIQNGAPDGFSLDYQSTLIQFISYEGSFTASGGVANGETSVDVGVEEGGSTDEGESLQLTGSGSVYSDFTWNGPSADSPGSENSGQTLEATGGTPDKLAIIDVNGGDSPSVGAGFDIIVQVQDNADAAANTSTDINITLDVGSGNGNLSGTVTGTITSGSSQTTISGIIYDTNETGVSITASDDASNLPSGTSAAFEVLEAASELVFVDIPSGGVVDSPLPEFTVEARRSDNSVDLNYSKQITLSLASGSGTLSGTTIQTAASGTATYNDISLDAAGDFTIEVTDGTITSAASATISIVDVEIVLNEFLADPGGLEVNNDGNQSNTDDEFIEFVNTGNSTLNISNWTIEDGTGVTHTFPSSTILEPLQAIVIFGGGSASGEFGKAITQIATGSDLSLNNTGDDIILKNDSGVEIISYSYGSSTAGKSSTRNPDLTGSFENHPGEAFSPGSRTNGSYFQPSITISGDAGWRMLSFPISGGEVEDISDDTAIQGISGGDNPGHAANFIFYKSGTSFQSPADVSSSFGNGYGFAVYFYDNTQAGSSELPITLEAFGSEPASNVTVNLNGSDNYTMVGNPFGSNYDLSEITESGGTIQNTVQFWDNNADTYVAQDRTGPFIASSWQGFWVESQNDAESITFPTSGKTESSSTATYFSKQNQTKADVEFTLSSESTTDKAIKLSFREGALPAWDLDDATKFIPLIESYATMAFVGEGENLQSVFSLPYEMEETYEVSLQESIVGIEDGAFTFSWEGIEALPANTELTFHDYKTGQSLNMHEVSEYTFEGSAAQSKKVERDFIIPGYPAARPLKAKTDEAPRFGITVAESSSVSNEPSTKPERFTLQQNYPNPFNPVTSIKYSLAEAGAVTLTVYNVMGQKVTTLVQENKSPGTYQVSWDASSRASGVYYYRLQAAGNVLTRKMTLIK